MKKIFIILGPPGSGKGTQARRIVEQFGFEYFGTGELIRQETTKATVYGKMFHEILTDGKGRLVPDDIIEKFIKEKLNELDLEKGVIFDGYPRTVPQAEALKTFLGEVKPKILNLKVDTQNILDRIATRKICKNCEKVFEKPAPDLKECDSCGGELITRLDDNPETVKNRIDVYDKQTEPLIEYYRENGEIIDIDGNPPIDEVWEEIKQKINAN